MPYNRSSYPRKRTYRRYKRQGAFRASIARISRAVTVRNAELKCLTQTFNAVGNWSPNLGAGVSVNSTWSFASVMAGMVQGTGVTNRIGNQVHVVSIELVCRLIPNQAAAALVGGTTCRLVLFKYKDPNGSLPNMTGTGPQIFDQNVVMTGRNITNIKSFALLEDFTHNMVLTTSDPAAGPQFSRIIRIPCNFKFNFSGNAGTISDCINNDVVMGICSDASGCCIVSTMTAKVWFKDL